METNLPNVNYSVTLGMVSHDFRSYYEYLYINFITKMKYTVQVLSFNNGVKHV